MEQAHDGELKLLASLANVDVGAQEYSVVILLRALALNRKRQLPRQVPDFMETILIFHRRANRAPGQIDDEKDGFEVFRTDVPTRLKTMEQPYDLEDTPPAPAVETEDDDEDGLELGQPAIVIAYDV